MGYVSFPLPKRRPPKPSSRTETENFITTGQGSGGIPATSLGTPVAGVLGRKRVSNPNTIWVGGLKPLIKTTYDTVIETEEIDHGDYVEIIRTETTTVTTSIIGYLCNLHMSICLGPDVLLHGVYLDNQRLWSGEIGPARTTISLPENETMLSEAEITFSGGAFNQSVEPLVTQADYPGYVGVATVFIKNMRCDRNMGNLSFEVSRVPNPLGLSDGINRDGRDLNIASAIVEVMTNDWGYGGLDIASVNDPVFTAAATKLASESNFCAVRLDNQTGIASVLVSMLEQAGGFMFQNPETGLIEIVLERPNEIDYASALALGRRNIISLQTFEKTTWNDAVDTLRGMFTERDADYNEVPIYMPNVAKLSQGGRKRSTQTIYYPFVTNRELVASLLGRDMALLAGPIYSLQVTTNRDAADRYPGSIVTISEPEYGLINVPCIVRKMRKQDRFSNTVVLNVRQLKLPDTLSYGTGGDPFDPGFDFNPKTPLGARIISSPYPFVHSALGISAITHTPSVNYLTPFVIPANDLQSDYDVYLRNPPDGDTDRLVGETYLYPTVGELVNPISKWDGTTTGTLPSIEIENVINAVNLTSQGLTGVRQGRHLVFINDEIFSFLAVSGGGTEWEMTGVYRGLVDTVAQDHPAGSKVFILGGQWKALPIQLADPPPFAPNLLFVPNTLIKDGTKSIGLESDDWTSQGIRPFSPPRPHNTKIDGQARSSTEVTLLVGASCTVTWATRARTEITYQGGITFQLDPPVFGEGQGTNFQLARVWIVDSGGTPYNCGEKAANDPSPGDPLANQLTFNIPDAAEGIGYLYVEAETTLSGITRQSIYQDRLPILIVRESVLITEDAASYFASEDGASFIAGEAY